MALPRLRALSTFTAAALLAALLSVTQPPLQAEAAEEHGSDLFPSGVGIDFAETPLSVGLTATAGPDAAGLQTGTHEGRTFWQTNVAARTTSFNLDVDNDYLHDAAGLNVLVSVTYFDADGQLTLSYDATDDPAKTAPVLELGNTGTWQTHTWQLSDARLADGLDGGDLRLGVDEDQPDVRIAAIRLGTVGASATLGTTAVDEGIVMRAGDAGTGLITGVQDGKGYWQTNPAAPAPGLGFFYGNVLDTYLYDTRDDVLITVEYFDEGNGSLGIHYDSPGETTPDKFKSGTTLKYGDSKSWKTHTFVLTDAILTNRSNGSDFRLNTGGATTGLKVASISVGHTPKTLDPKAGLNGIIADAARSLAVAREGERDGNYPGGSKETLTEQLDAANAVSNNPDAEAGEVEAAAKTLLTALNAFLDSRITTNLTVGATVSASSSSAEQPADLAIDHDNETTWSSDPSDEKPWLKVDLGEALTINQVTIEWPAASSADYTIETSVDGENFTEVRRAGSPGSNRTVKTAFAPVEARFVRIVMSGPAEGLDSFSVKEFEVRHAPVPVPDPELIKTRYPTDTPVIADFNVKDYKADSKGKRDSTAAIQQALYDCYDAGGGTVWLPAGSYRVTNTLEVSGFCTLMGDWHDPDVKSDKGSKGDYGTVLIADLASGDAGPTLFRVGGSSGVVGVTTYYPQQNVDEPVPYNYTFEIPGGAWVGNENYMMATVANVTMLNSYRGIGISTMPNDRGTAPSSGQVHESATVRNVKGTVLFEGTGAYNGADVGTWENITFDNRYWAEAGSEFQAPDRAALDAWTRANGTAFRLGDLEWDQFNNITAANYKIGIHIVKGQRISFAGAFNNATITDTDTALLVEEFDSRWGMVFASSSLQGTEHAVLSQSQGYVKLTGTTVDGAVEGIVHQLEEETPVHPGSSAPEPVRAKLIDAAAKPFNAPHEVGYQTGEDATEQIQAALDKAGKMGGGIVYLPAGWYTIRGHLTVPAEVELRGASAVPNRDQLGASGGTVLLAYEGRNAPDAETAEALITLNGDNAGVRGLRVFYPENNPAADDGLVPYPYTIRGNGDHTYVVNVGLPNTWNAVDMATHTNDGFLVRELAGVFLRHGVSVGASADGRIESVLANGNATTRIGYFLPNWASEQHIFAQVIDKYTRAQAELITVDGATDLRVLDVFGYGFHDGLVVKSGTVDAFYLGTDNLGPGGFTVKVAETVPRGDVTVTNLLRYNGTTSSGPVVAYNLMAINMLQQSLSVTVDPAGGGAVQIIGNRTEPGRYEKGSSVTLSATPDAEHRFVDWRIGDQVLSTEPDAVFVVTADSEVIAHFAPR